MIKSSWLRFSNWIHRIIFIPIGSYILFKLALQAGDTYLQNIFLAAVIAYCFTWSKILLVPAFTPGKYRTKIRLAGIYKPMLKSFLSHGIAAGCAVVLLKTNPFGDIQFFGEINLFSSNNLLTTCCLIFAYAVTAVYTIGGVICIVVSGKSKLMLAGYGVLFGIMALSYGILLELVLLFCPMPISGLILALSGFLLYFFLESMKGTQSTLPKIVSLFVMISFFSGMSLMVTGLL